MKLEVCAYHDAATEGWVSKQHEDLKAKKIHVVSAATPGMSNCSAYCELPCGLSNSEIRSFINSVNAGRKTGTLWPRSNLTILPCSGDPEGNRYTQDGAYKETEITDHLRVAFIIERDSVKSGRMVFDFGCCWVDPSEYNRCIRKLIAEEFSALPGTAVIIE